VVLPPPPPEAGSVGWAAGAQAAKSATITILTRNVFNFLTNMGSSPFPLLLMVLGKSGPFGFLDCFYL
jgi:hypothetical protein